MKHILKQREISGLEIFESLYPGNLRQPRHTHVLASFSFVLAGSYVENLGDKPQTRQPSTIVFHPPHESHAVEYRNDPVRILSVQMDSKRLSYFRDRSIVFESRASERSATTAWLGRRLYKEFHLADSASAIALEGLICEILAEASRAKAARKEVSPRWLGQAKDLLHDNFTEPLAFDDIAKSIGVHPVHLARVFRQKNGCTIGEYLRRLRIEFAAREIAAGDKALSEIAIVAGFADQSHLTKTFKTYFGLIPSEYRRLHKR
jgi:AraC family transcriptional regulator